MRYLISLWALAVAFYAAESVAQENASNSHREAAIELLKLMDVERQMMGGASAMADAMVQQNPALSGYRDVLLEWAGSFMTWEVFGPQLVTMYADAFGESELREMTAFYRTPTGQKALRLQPELMSRGAQIGATEAQAHQHELQRMLEQRAAELQKAP